MQVNANKSHIPALHPPGKYLAFDDLAGLDAAGADSHSLACTVDLGSDRLQVYVPAAAGRVVGVGDVVTELRTLAAEITFLCHDCLAPISISYRRNFQNY
jgi:hypothetical protein